MTIKFTDRSPVGRIKETKEGYLVATARVARIGNQSYLARELGDVAIAAGFKPDDVVRVYRSPEQVFSDKTLASLTRVPVTLDHPPEMVDSENWSKYAIGEVGDAYGTEPEWIVVNPMIKDAAGLAKVKTSHKEISLGYQAEVIVARDGIDADFEMIDIDVNHLAMVPRGRAGSQARIGDAQQWGAAPVNIEDKVMTIEVKTVVLGDKAVEVVAKDAETVAAILKDHQKTVDAKDTEIGELKAKLADAEGKILSDEALAELVAKRVEADTKRAAVKAKFGDEAVKDASDAEIAGMFKVIGAAVNDSARDAIKGKKPVVTDAQAAEDRILAAQRKFLNLEAK